MGRGFTAVKPHWMIVRDAQTNPSMPPASRGTPCVRQPGTVGSPMSSPSLFAPQPMETHVFRQSSSGFSLNYKGLLPLMLMMMMIAMIKEVLDFRQWLILPKSQHRLSRQRKRQLENAAELSCLVCFSISEAYRACLADAQCAANKKTTDAWRAA